VSTKKYSVSASVSEEMLKMLESTAVEKGTSIEDVINDALNAYFFLGLNRPPKTDVDMTERLVVFLFELLKATCGDRK
jgi:hypothetical protein